MGVRPDDLKIEKIRIPANLAHSTQNFSLILMSWTSQKCFFFNFWVGPEDDLGMVEAWLGGCWGVVRPMIPLLGGSIDFDTGNRFPLVLGARVTQKPAKNHIKIQAPGLGPGRVPDWHPGQLAVKN